MSSQCNTRSKWRKNPKTLNPSFKRGLTPACAPPTAVLVEVDRNTDTVTCRPLHARSLHAGPGDSNPNPEPLLAEVAGVVMTPAPRRPAAAKTTVVELLRWQPYGVRVDESAKRLRCVGVPRACSGQSFIHFGMCFISAC